MRAKLEGQPGAMRAYFGAARAAVEDGKRANANLRGKLRSRIDRLRAKLRCGKSGSRANSGTARTSRAPNKCSAKMTTLSMLMGPGILGILLATQRFPSQGAAIGGPHLPMKRWRLRCRRWRRSSISEEAIQNEDRPQQVGREVVGRREEAGRRRTMTAEGNLQ